jgi:hypothetical protein
VYLRDEAGDAVGRDNLYERILCVFLNVRHGFASIESSLDIIQLRCGGKNQRLWSGKYFRSLETHPKKN